VREVHATPGSVVAISEVALRAIARVEGRVGSVHIEPAGVAPTLIARVDDGTGELDAVFMGRRSIDGIEPGRALAVEGRVSMANGRLRMYNPRYELQWRD